LKSANQVSAYRAEAALSLSIKDAAQAERNCAVARSSAVGSKVKPLRILHVINSMGVGGTERGVLKVIEGLDPQLFDQKVCAIRSIDQEFTAFSGLNGRVIMAGRVNSGFQFSIFRLAQVFRTHRPDIVHSRNWGAIEAIPAARLARVPIAIHSEHGYEMDILQGLPARRRLFRRACYGLSDAVFTVSRELHSYHCHEGWFPAERMQVIPNGVDTKLFAPNSEKRECERLRLNFPSDAVVLGTVGRLVGIKNQRMFLQAAEQLIQDNPNVRVLLVGDGSERDQLRNYVDGSPHLRNRTVFLGMSRRVEDAYQAMDVFVLPSFKEGISNTLLEAMASGLPCLATAVGGNPEVIENGCSGLLFETGDVTQLTQLLRRLVLEPAARNQLARAARERAVTKFSLGRMIENYRSLYCTLAKRSDLLTRN